MKGYDPECLRLAEHFMTDARMSPPLEPQHEKRLTDELAQEIQDAVEAFMQVNHL